MRNLYAWVFIAYTLLLFIGMGLITTHALAEPYYKEDIEKKDIEAAASSLALAHLINIDRGVYEIDDDFATAFKAKVTQPQWNIHLTMIRGPLGFVVERKKVNSQLSDKLPDAPDGEYVIVTFQTDFTQRKNIREIVTMMKDGDQFTDWKLAGYYTKEQGE